MPLQLVYEVRPFAQWTLDFIGVINPNFSAGHKFILTATDYCMRWTQAQAYKNCTTNVVIKFLDEHVITRFGIPFALVCDNGPAFSSAQFIQWAFEYKIILKYSSNYYPQGNGVAKSTNKNLLEVIKRLLENNLRDWHTQLKFALWADRT
jgi:transposase InsO family protein